MPLSAGEKLGPYEIVTRIGAGGMGEVFRARDSRMGREVAIKISAERFSERFDKEVRAIASLNHPNVCTLHDVGPNYLVMEMVEGSTLAERIKQGPIPMEEALVIARQIAEALEAAHEKQIVHRDLKPGNIKIKPDGTVKVLDFGLAKVGGPAEMSGNPDHTPTLTVEQATRAGMIMGTAGYMAPEQAKGKAVDKRADIWAFGVVLYEMLTGARLFEGETVSEILAGVLKEQPDLNRLPARVRLLLRRCLEKDPAKRLRDIGDMGLLLESVPEPQPVIVSKEHGLRWLWPGVAAACLLVAVAVSVVHFREKAPAALPLVRFQFPTPAVGSELNTYLTLSPNGHRLAYTANGPDGTLRLWVRSLDTLDARMLPGTENGVSPFWSPDGMFLAFAQGNNLKKVDASGDAPPLTLCESPALVGVGSWSPEGVIVFGGRGQGPLRRVSASGGTPAELTTVTPNEAFHTMPFFLPDGRHFLYLRASGDPNLQGIYTGSLDTKPSDAPSKRVLAARLNVAYVPASGRDLGRLLFLRESTLMAQPFDTGRLELTGEPVPIAERVAAAGSFAQFAVSGNGVLAYRSGGGLQASELTWFDRKGTVVGRAGNAGPYRELNLSPDGKQVASYQAGGQSDIWIFEFTRGTNTRLTFDPAIERYPVWSPDGKQIAYSASSQGVGATIYRKASDGSGQTELLQTPQRTAVPLDWSRDGRFLLYQTIGQGTGPDLWVLPMGGDHKAIPFVNTPAIEIQGQFSPDGRWIVYTSFDSGSPEIYVRPFGAGGSDGSGKAAQALTGKWMISNTGGIQPRWRRDGREILYLSTGLKLMSVDVNGAGSSFQAGLPKALFDVPIFGGTGLQATADLWDISPDGQRFLVNTEQKARDSNLSQITVVLNWPAALNK